MIELLTKLGEVLKEVPEFAIWIMLGLLVYKIIIVGSYFSIIKLFIIKLHEWLMKERIQITSLKIDRHIISCDDTPSNLLEFINSIKNTGATGINSEYVHSSDIEWVTEAIKEKKERGNERDKRK
jgi:hypothetical protein